MGLHKQFPKNPFEIIEPDLRWFPGNDSLGEKGREKLLPPLVNKIRKEIYDWRKKGYPNISQTTKSLGLAPRYPSGRFQIRCIVISMTHLINQLGKLINPYEKILVQSL